MSLRDRIWRRVTVAALRSTNTPQPHRAPSADDEVRPIRIGERYPGLADAPVYVSENTPVTEENKLSTRFVTKLILWMKEWYGLGRGFPDPLEGGMPEHPPEFLTVWPTPQRPDQYAEGADVLAGMAQRGPYSMLLRPTGPNSWRFDVSALEAVATRPPFVPTGGVATFERSGPGQDLKTVSITRGGVTVTPDDGAAFDSAAKHVLVGLNTLTTFIEHLTAVHLCGAGTWAICTYLAFRADHPLRILMQPFIVETVRVNNYNIDGLIKTENSNVPTYSGYYLETLNSLMTVAVKGFDARWLDADYRAEVCGQTDDPSFPTMGSAARLWRIFRSLTSEWCREHLGTVDDETRRWVRELDERVPNGIKGLIGIRDLGEELTAEHVALLLATGMFTASCWHYVIADMSRDYELHMDVNPPAITGNGQPTLGIVLEKRNSIMIAGLLRYRLLDDAAYMPTPAMKAMWSTFQKELKAYEVSLPENIREYCIQPSKVASSVHA